EDRGRGDRTLAVVLTQVHVHGDLHGGWSFRRRGRGGAAPGRRNCGHANRRGQGTGTGRPKRRKREGGRVGPGRGARESGGRGEPEGEAHGAGVAGVRQPLVAFEDAGCAHPPGQQRKRLAHVAAGDEVTETV